MRTILLWLLHRLPPEPAHQCAVLMLRLYQRFLSYLPAKRSPGPVLGIRIRPHLGFLFPNRLGLAAGFDKNAEVFFGLSQLGFGFIEVGSVTPKPQSGNPKPRIWRVAPSGLVNHLGFNNCGLEAFRQNLESYRGLTRIPILANIGKGRATEIHLAHEDYALGFRHLQGVVDGFVVNVSSPNTPQLFKLQTVSFLESLVPHIPKGVPTLIKLSPDLEDDQVAELAQVVSELDAFSGMVLTNTSRKLAEPDFANGGLSGVRLFERSLYLVGLTRKNLRREKILIGVGGITRPEDAVAMREAGADLIEIYTSFIYKGPAWVKELSQLSVLRA